ncbi:hypothetical protein [Streptomyces dioscori]|uniref:hypothetical protein n=1 Tax=Streptomyces dioscori TaxID=2109333 RepID=UPI00131D3187|nr:hypothetical protein [Streptomyces dioscori]
MKGSEITTLVVGVLALAGVLWQGRRPRYDSRDRLKKDLELLTAMPDDLEVKGEYKQHISDAFRALLQDEDQRSRDWTGVGLGIGFMLVGGTFAWFSFDRGGVWHIGTAFFALLFVIGMLGIFTDFPKRLRDESGNRLSQSRAREPGSDQS